MYISYQDPALLNNIKDLKPTDIVQLNCCHCNSSFTRSIRDIRSNIKRGRMNIYCSNKCIGKHSRTSHKKVCQYCQSFFISKYRTTYCSRACSNSANPRRKKTRFCSCGNPLEKQRKVCLECKIKLNQAMVSKWDGQSKSEVCRTSIAKHARWVMRNTTSQCAKCGYSKHTEVCHIKSVASFPKETLLSIINSLDNLILLCPNCHWELDHP